MKKRLVAFLLVLIMVLGMLPVSAFAADDGVSPQALESKEGYTFKGWADSSTATTAQYQPGDTVDVKHENSPKTVYAVWEGSDPIPVPSYDDLKSAIGQIQVKDVSTPSCGTENYDLIDNTQSEPFNWTKTAR